jgi:hypothetical protein
MPEHMPDVFDRSSQVAVLWRVSLTPSVYANCHFFDVHEIEFDLDHARSSTRTRLTPSAVSFKRWGASSLDRSGSASRVARLEPLTTCDTSRPRIESWR